MPSVAEPECLAPCDGFACAGELVVELLLPAEQVIGGEPDAGELELGGVGRAAAELVELAHHLQSGGTAGHDEQRLAFVAQFLVDDRVDHVDVGDAAVADPHLVAVDDPVCVRAGAVPAGRGAQVADVAATLGLGDRQRGELEVARGSEALRSPLQHLLGGGRLPDRRERERGHHHGQSDARAPPEQFLHEHR